MHSKCYKDWRKARELRYGEFAYLCGQGETLLSMLRLNEAHHMQVFATEYESSTLERIGHLEALLHQEYEQMTRLWVFRFQKTQSLFARYEETFSRNHLRSGSACPS